MLDCTPKFSYTQYMLTLTKASIETKLIIKWGIISIITLFVLFFLLKGAIYLKELFFPTPPPKPTVLYGQLPVILFPQSVSDQNFTYSIYTISGDLPSLPTVAKIYKMTYNPPDLLALQKAQKMVSAIGFNSTPYEVSNKIYTWSANDKIQRHLTMDILTYNFDISSTLTSDPFVVSGVNVPDKQRAIDFIHGSVGGMGLLYDDLDQTKSKAVLLKADNDKFVEASSFPDAQFVRVDLFQKDVDGLPIYYENADKSSMNFLIGGGESSPQILRANFFYQTPTQDFSTYPLKTIMEAYSELATGSAYIASYYGTNKNIKIRDAFLAYYMGSVPQSYLMPIFVFGGDDGFYAYVSAVTDEWINK